MYVNIIEIFLDKKAVGKTKIGKATKGPNFAQNQLFVMVCRKLFEKTRRIQLVEIKGRKTGRKLTGRMIIECKIVE